MKAIRQENNISERGSEELEVIEQREVEASAIYLADKANIDVQVATARAYPRDVIRATNNSVALATSNKDVAESCGYVVPRAGKKITGPSVHLAKIVAHCWGNIRMGSRVVDIQEKYVVSEGVCWDMENNVAVEVRVSRLILDKNGKRYSDDMIGVTGNAANAIALRNAIFAVIPSFVVDRVYKAAQATITGDLSTEDKLLKKRKQVLDAMKSAYKITEEEILSSIGKSSINHIGANEIAILIGIGQSIKDGETTVNEAFREKTSVKDREIAAERDRVDKWLESVTEADVLEDWLDNTDLESAGEEVLKKVRKRLAELLADGG